MKSYHYAMTKKNATSFFILFFMFVTYSGFSQKNIIKWSPSAKLTWEDFNEKKGTKLAYSAVAIKLKPIISNTKKIKLEVYAYFDKSISRTGIFDEKVLEHEQLHFQIGELFARKLRKRILNYEKSKFFKDRNEFSKVYKANYAKYLAYQRQYDKETVHSVDRAAQKRWEEKIKKELKEYQRYSRKTVELSR